MVKINYIVGFIILVIILVIGIITIVSKNSPNVDNYCSSDADCTNNNQVCRSNSCQVITQNTQETEYLLQQNSSSSTTEFSDFEKTTFITTEATNFEYDSYSIYLYKGKSGEIDSWQANYNGYNADESDEAWVIVYVFDSSSTAENYFEKRTESIDGEVETIKNIKVGIASSSGGLESRIWRYDNKIIDLWYKSKSGNNLFDAYFVKYS